MDQRLDAHLIGSLLGLLAHDLRNPLSALHSNVGFLESVVGSADPDAREALADVTASCSSLKHIIDNLELLGLAVLDQPPRLERGPVGLVDLVNDVLGRLEVVASSYGVQITFEGAAQRQVRLLAHREMLARALANLLFNAIQHGGSKTAIAVSVAVSGTSATVVISDSGPPLSEELRATAFTAPGQLVSKSESYGRYSRGLGLFAATIAAGLAGAEVRAFGGNEGNAFELRGTVA